MQSTPRVTASAVVGVLAVLCSTAAAAGAKSAHATASGGRPHLASLSAAGSIAGVVQDESEHADLRARMVGVGARHRRRASAASLDRGGRIALRAAHALSRTSASGCARISPGYVASRGQGRRCSSERAVASSIDLRRGALNVASIVGVFRVLDVLDRGGVVGGVSVFGSVSFARPIPGGRSGNEAGRDAGADSLDGDFRHSSNGEMAAVPADPSRRAGFAAAEENTTDDRAEVDMASALCDGSAC